MVARPRKSIDLSKKYTSIRSIIIYLSIVIKEDSKDFDNLVLLRGIEK